MYNNSLIANHVQEYCVYSTVVYGSHDIIPLLAHMYIPLVLACYYCG